MILQQNFQEATQISLPLHHKDTHHVTVQKPHLQLNPTACIPLSAQLGQFPCCHTTLLL